MLKVNQYHDCWCHARNSIFFLNSRCLCFPRGKLTITYVNLVLRNDTKQKYHYDVIKWKHFPHKWTFVRENPPAAGGFPTQRPVTRKFDVFFDVGLNKWLSKQSRRRWFETPSRPLWRHCNVVLDFITEFSTTVVNLVILTASYVRISLIAMIRSYTWKSSQSTHTNSYGTWGHIIIKTQPSCHWNRVINKTVFIFKWDPVSVLIVDFIARTLHLKRQRIFASLKLLELHLPM